jgi:DNA-binding MarR family transcriptional regulator
MVLLSLLRALSGLDKNFPLPYAVFLLEVARNEGCSLGDLRKATGMPLPTLSRILWALSTRRQNGAEPYRLIEQDYAPDNRRRKAIRLSPKGRKFISRMTAILDQAAA